jgi:Ca-activated chloride channel homolog
MIVLAPHFLWLLVPLVILVFYFRQQFTKELRWLFVALLFTVVALERPVFEKSSMDAQEQGSDVILALDLSYSMQANDIKPTRLAKAQEMISTLVKKNHHDRFGVIGFTSNAIVLSPLTKDEELLLHLIGGVDSELIMTKSTRILPALELARKMSHAKHPKVLLFSDGGDESVYDKEAQFLKQSGIELIVIMIATDYGTSLKDKYSKVIKDELGNIVITARNRAVEVLSQNVIDSGDVGDLLSILDDKRDDDYSSQTQMMQYEELFYYPIALALFSFLMAMTTLSKHLRKIVVMIALFFGINLNASLLDGYYFEHGITAYHDNNYERALEFFQKSEKDNFIYNRAHSLYRLGKYEEALFMYERLKSANPIVKSGLYFNIANCYIRLQEFDKAKETFVKSLTLHYTKEADENLAYINNATEQDHLITGQVEGKKRAQSSAQENTSKKEGDNKEDKKEGGSSNMKVEGAAASGSSDGGKKVKNEGQFSLQQGNAKLSSRQYELINKRGVHEEKPW